MLNIMEKIKLDTENREHWTCGYFFSGNIPEVTKRSEKLGRQVSGTRNFPQREQQGCSEMVLSCSRTQESAVAGAEGG